MSIVIYSYEQLKKPVKQEKEKKYSSFSGIGKSKHEKAVQGEIRIDYSGFAIPKPAPKAKSKYSESARVKRYSVAVKEGYCKLCGAAGNTVLHHIKYRSQGGMETKENLIELGDDFLCSCHRNIHAGLIPMEKIIAAKAKEGCVVTVCE